MARRQPIDTVRWEVDDRPPTWWTRSYVRAMWWRRDDRAFSGAGRTLRAARRRQRTGDHPPTRWTRLVRDVTASRLPLGDGGTPGPVVWTVRPRWRRPVVRVVHLHGGGYVHPLTVDYWRLVRALASVPAEVVVPAYPLAPDHHADEVVPWLAGLAADAPARTSVGALPLVLSGDSAGGALALFVARELADRRPACVVALSPWLDPRLADPEVDALDPSDPVLEESGLRAAARWWAGSRAVEDPRVDPLRGGLTDLPPVHLWIGDRDLLRPAVDELARRARVEGAALHVREVSAMFHVWMTRAVPEGRRTRRDLVALLRRVAADTGRPVPGVLSRRRRRTA
ncbi:alpha/beta hydrolase fold domain-containing protein [Nocardioides sp. Leaf307]|uniref:alpha/beta hydrolase fold domain-containing protein n=1 Tax=Nocardioides sp. Leaf307 TaxID=1736331 RepID=UPI000703B089|nr:alpha/beta hydrolase fold domain-containing protein [Nocardioides sp. Leaf307]KQQ42752.1 hypothetical protein ASF50_01535 [Nocardioides sp. Leaf307]